MTTYNFNAGPAILPRVVLEQVHAELLDYQGRGMSIIEMSHRSKEYEAINVRAEARMLALLGLESSYRVLFLQGGASTQFAMLPMNMLAAEQTADYLMSGAWSDKALEEAQRFGRARDAGGTAGGDYRRVPRPEQLHLSENPAYVHYTTNETIQGVQYQYIPEVGGRRLVADMSSDICSRPIDAGRFSLIYAGAQKNLGPAGATVVIVREDWLGEAPRDLPVMLRYSTFAKNNSLYNTPPVFAVYVLDLVLGWIGDAGGLAGMERRNQEKAGLVYAAIDQSEGFYRGHADQDSRSLMNVTFRLPSESLEQRFASAALAHGMVGLAGHRSVGGIRASLYNAMDADGARALAAFMLDFADSNG
ncbi:MAG: 3-phosphoserine/phosphohydroxythreonine transaminase [Roseiflexaceae bacterium]|nr:3-phosphoserine/phosphohydroxythreonine transaminase [Roseiflexaceae bacterium]